MRARRPRLNRHPLVTPPSQQRALLSDAGVSPAPFPSVPSGNLSLNQTMLFFLTYETCTQRRYHNESRSGNGSKAAQKANFDYVEIWAAKLRNFSDQIRR